MVFSALPIYIKMHKTHIFEQKNNQKRYILPTYLLYFFFEPVQETKFLFCLNIDSRIWRIILVM